MPDSWEPINMLPDDGRTALFTRSVNQAGNVIHFTTPAGLVIVEGHYDDAGVMAASIVQVALAVSMKTRCPSALLVAR